MPTNPFDSSKLYDRYSVTVRVRERLCGGKPKNDDLLADHIRRTTGHDDEITKRQIADATAKLPDLEGLQELAEAKIEKSSTRFLADDKGLYLDTYQIKSMIKQAASMLGIYKKKRGSKQICAEGCEVRGPDHPSRVYLGKDKADGIEESVVHAMTPQGPIHAIKRVEYVEGVTLKFEVWILTTEGSESRHIGEKELVQILTFSQENGLGADRTKGMGKFNVVEFGWISP